MKSEIVFGILTRWMRLIVAGAILAFTFNLAAPAMPVVALGWEVDIAVDDPNKDGCDPWVVNDCSLRGAINRANANPGPDTIYFRAAIKQLLLPALLGRMPTSTEISISWGLAAI